MIKQELDWIEADPIGKICLKNLSTTAMKIGNKVTTRLTETKFCESEIFDTLWKLKVI